MTVQTVESPKSDPVAEPADQKTRRWLKENIEAIAIAVCGGSSHVTAPVLTIAMPSGRPASMSSTRNVVRWC